MNTTLPDPIRYAIISAIAHNILAEMVIRLCNKHPHLASSIRFYASVASQVHREVYQ